MTEIDGAGVREVGFLRARFFVAGSVLAGSSGAGSLRVGSSGAGGSGAGGLLAGSRIGTDKGLFGGATATVLRAMRLNAACFLFPLPFAFFFV